MWPHDASLRDRWLAAAILAAGLVLTGCGPPDAEPSSEPSTPESSERTTPESSEPSAPESSEPSSPVDVPLLHPSVDDWPATVVTVDPGADGEVVQVAVRIADTPERRTHGLMEVPAVPDDVGMLFTYDGEQHGGFWMRGTLTDLDIAWVSDDGTIVATDTMTVCQADPCRVYQPDASYSTALEVPAGWLADNGVEVGDRIEWDRSVG